MVAPAPAPEVVVREVPVEKIVEVVVTAAPLPAYTPLPIHTPMPTYTPAPVEVVYEEVIVEVVVTSYAYSICYTDTSDDVYFT